MSEPDDPPRKHYGLKPREFERVNVPASAPAPADRPLDAPPPNPAGADPNAPIDIRSLVRSATNNLPLLSRTPAVPRPNEVHAILRQNLAVADAAGLNGVSAQPRRSSRRKRDFWVLLIAGNVFILGVYSLQVFVGFQVMCLAAGMPLEFGNLIRHAAGTPQMLAIPSLGGMFYSAALAWLMFGVMNNY